MAIVRLGAFLELASDAGDQVDFRVSEFAVFHDGSELVLHSDRGFSVRVAGGESAEFWWRTTAADVRRDVYTVVLPDDAEETGEQHDWYRLVRLLADRDVHVSVDDLRGLPYEARLSPGVTARVEGDGRRS